MRLFRQSTASLALFALILAGCGAETAPAASNSSAAAAATTTANTALASDPASLAPYILPGLAPVNFTVASSAPAAGAVRILLNDTATKARLQALLSVGAPSATRFKSLVDSQMAGGDAYAFKPWFAALMFQLSGNASYCAFAVSQTDAIVRAEEVLIASNQRAVVSNDSYLDVGGTVGNIAMVYDWCRDTVSATQKTRWINYSNQAVSNVWNPDQAKWGNTVYAWSGWSINNPSNNYYSSFLEATMLLGLATQGENPQAANWLNTFRVSKLEQQLFPSFNRDLTGGGSREGTGYGTAMMRLFRLYDWWEKSTGERIAARTTHTLASLPYLMHNITPTLDRLSPTGDHARDSTAALFDYHREYLQTLMRLFQNDPASRAAKTLLAQSTVPRMSSSFEYYHDFLYDQSDITEAPLSTLPAAYWASGIGHFYSRSSWDKDAAYLDFSCGPYTESHAHRDQGSFVLFRGDWLAYDQNVNSRSGIVQEELPHNIVRIEQNGNVVPQVLLAPSCQMLALADNADYSYGLARITPIYGGKATVAKVEREFVFLKPGTLILFDRAETVGAGTSRVWTLNLPKAPTVSGDTFSMVNGSNRLDVVRVAPAGLSTQVYSWPSLDVNMLAGARVDETLNVQCV